MSIFIRPPDITLLSIILLLCTVIAIGFLVYKRFNGLSYWGRLLCTTAMLQTSPPNSILPSFGALRHPPSYAVSGLRDFAPNPLGDMGDIGMKGISADEIQHSPETPSLPKLLYPPENSSALSLSSYLASNASACSSLRVSSSRASQATTASDNDKLPPNITVPISRQTALDCMIDRWLSETERARKTGGKHSTKKLRYLPPAPVTRISEVPSRTPSIIITQPSSHSLSVDQSSYAFLLSTGPDEDPFFWDTIPLPPPRVSVFASLPVRKPTRRSKDTNKENRSAVAIVTSTVIKPPLSAHLSVPSHSGKRRSKGRRIVLGDSTNSHSGTKLSTVTYPTTPFTHNI